jgi:thioredoxin-related protein
LKKFLFILLISALFIAGCSQKEENKSNTPVNPVSPGENLEIENISDEKEREELQRFIEIIYYNPVVVNNEGKFFLENEKNLLIFSAHYKKEYSNDKTLPEIVKELFDVELSDDVTINESDYNGYDASQRSIYLPVVEGIYKNNELVIVKAGFIFFGRGNKFRKKSSRNNYWHI